MAGVQGIGYKVDIAFVIDATGSMTPLMEVVKQNARELGDQIVQAMEKSGRRVEFLRMKVIDFADFKYEGEDAIHCTDFFEMPAEKDKFDEVVNNIKIDYRGGDIPENGLEALFAAMSSDWVTIGAGEKGRHIIVLMTDAVPLHLGERDGCAGYVKDDYPADVAELTEMWDADSQSTSLKLSKNNRRLLLYAPTGKDDEGHTWEDIKGWEWTTSVAVTDADGLKGIDINVIVADIVKSL